MLLKRFPDWFKKLLEKEKKEEPASHQHEWELYSQTYASPASSISSVPTNISPDLLQKLTFGFTTQLWRCPKCFETKKEELLGSETSTLEELIAKVEEIGPQIIETPQGRYLLSKFAPAPPGVLPVR